MRWSTLEVGAVLAWATGAAASNCCSWPSGSNDVQELQSLLSPHAKIILPSESSFADATSRWSALDAPEPNVVVLVATEKDVAATVQFANQKELPFLAYAGSHGSITTLGAMKCGIEIDLHQLTSVEVASDGQTATFGGGIMAVNVTNALWAAGKQTVTGTCECVSLLGPGLGGGHGWLQGRHGLVADQFVSMNVVLANGSLVTINKSSNLFWGMKGAGHNFGIVTSLTMNVYDIEYRDWAIETITYSGDQIADVYTQSNKHLVGQPMDITSWTYWMNVPSADSSNPVIVLYLIQEGVTAVDSSVSQPFHDIKPLSIEPISGTYQDLANWTGIALASPPCQKFGTANPRFPLYLQKYSIPAMEQAYELFAKNVRGSSPFNNSIYMFEGYAMEEVHAIPAASAAFGFRDENILSAPLIIYERNGTALDLEVKNLGDSLRNILHVGTGLSEIRTYVNYAYGDEGPLEWYGYEEWRVARLQSLKQQYDPKHQFSFYAPIR